MTGRNVETAAAHDRWAADGMNRRGMTRHYEVVVVGGGQAGLAVGYYLARQDLNFVILDAGPRIGHVWRSRWHSLRLFTPSQYDALPGLAFPGDPDDLPGKEDVADYLEVYAKVFDLPVRSGEAVLSVRPLGGGGFEVATQQAMYTADQVVVATGPFQKPLVPAVAETLSDEVFQIHSSAYREPEQLPAGAVLVVGGGNSGVQIAAELAVTRPTWLSVGQQLGRVPERLLGRSIFWWFDRAGLLAVTVDSRIGRRASGRELLVGQSPRMLARSTGVQLAGRTVGIAGHRVFTQGGTTIEPAAIVWATGFRPDFGFVHAPVLDAAGRPVHHRGVTTTAGLYFLGLPWQHTRGSALLGFVGRDAEYIARQIADHRQLARAGYRAA